MSMYRYDSCYVMTYINRGKSTHIWWVCLLLIYSSNHCLLRAYYVPGIILTIGDTVSKTGQVSSLVEF